MSRRAVRLVLVALAAVLVLPLAPRAAAGQRADTTLRLPDSTEVQVLRTRDGTRLVGRIVELTADSLAFAAPAGVLRLARANVASLETVPRTRLHDGEIWFPNPNATRLLFAPTGRMLPRGSSYFSDTYLFFLGYNVGVTDRVTLGGGLSIFPFEDFSENAFFVTPKVGLYQSEEVNVAAGALVGWIGGGEGDYGGLLYGVSTFGSTDHSVTAGAGYGFAADEIADEPVFMLGGESRLSRRIAFVSENYVIAGEDPLVSYGLRFMGEQITVDLALLNTLGDDAIFPGIPFVDFVFVF